MVGGASSDYVRAREACALLEKVDIGGITMGKLYDHCQSIQQHIERSGLDVFKARGEIALHCGFLISLVGPNDPDDPAKIEALRNAAKDVFGISLQ